MAEKRKREKKTVTTKKAAVVEDIDALKTKLSKATHAAKMKIRIQVPLYDGPIGVRLLTFRYTKTREPCAQVGTFWTRLLTSKRHGWKGLEEYHGINRGLNGSETDERFTKRLQAALRSIFYEDNEELNAFCAPFLSECPIIGKIKVEFADITATRGDIVLYTGYHGRVPEIKQLTASLVMSYCPYGATTGTKEVAKQLFDAIHSKKAREARDTDETKYWNSRGWGDLDTNELKRATLGDVWAPKLEHIATTAYRMFDEDQWTLFSRGFVVITPCHRAVRGDSFFKTFSSDSWYTAIDAMQEELQEFFNCNCGLTDRRAYFRFDRPDHPLWKLLVDKKAFRAKFGPSAIHSVYSPYTGCGHPTACANGPCTTDVAAHPYVVGACMGIMRAFEMIRHTTYFVVHPPGLKQNVHSVNNESKRVVPGEELEHLRV